MRNPKIPDFGQGGVRIQGLLFLLDICAVNVLMIMIIENNSYIRKETSEKRNYTLRREKNIKLNLTKNMERSQVTATALGLGKCIFQFLKEVLQSTYFIHFIETKKTVKWTTFFIFYRVKPFNQVPFGLALLQQSRGIYVDYTWDIIQYKQNFPKVRRTKITAF